MKKVPCFDPRETSIRFAIKKHISDEFQKINQYSKLGSGNRLMMSFQFKNASQRPKLLNSPVKKEIVFKSEATEDRDSCEKIGMLLSFLVHPKLDEFADPKLLSALQQC